MALHLPVHDVVLYSLLVIERNLNIENTSWGGGCRSRMFHSYGDVTITYEICIGINILR